jgi:TPR repeat protein
MFGLASRDLVLHLVCETAYNYGACLIEGKGVEQNIIVALHYFKLAKDQGYVNELFIILMGLVSAARYFKLAAN